MSDFGFIYFIYDFKTKQTKIGKTSKHPAYRLKELQTGNGTKLELLHFYESNQISKEESCLHNRYKHYRTIGEWFEIPSQLLSKLTNTVLDEHQDNLEISQYKSTNIKPQNHNNRFAYLPEEIKSIILQNASSTIRVEPKENGYKCYDSHDRCVGKICVNPNSMYWQPDDGQNNYKKLDVSNFLRYISA